MNDFETMDDKGNVIESALRAGSGLADAKQHQLPGGRTGFIIPDGFKMHTVEPDNPELPDHVIASPNFEDGVSFIEYVNLYKGPETAIFASLEMNSMAAVLDYHGKSEGKAAKPDRCRHKALHAFPFSVPWAKWREIDGEAMAQEQLGYFLEEMLYTIAEPSGAGLLELASELKIDRQFKFKSGTRLQSGANSLVYEEQDETSGRTGKIEVPEGITISCPIFHGGEREACEAKLRYRLVRGEIKFRFDIPMRLECEQAAFARVVEGVRSATDCPVFMGRA